jgi:hypothetical protein
VYKITFEDGTTFVDKDDVNNSKWNTMPKKIIKRIDYELYGIKLKLENFESYNHLIKHANVILGRKFDGIVGIIMLAKHKEINIQFFYNLITGEFEQKIIDINELKPSSGWKEGLKGEIPSYKIY